MAPGRIADDRLRPFQLAAIVPLKMFLATMLNLKYIVSTPDFMFNI